jgi:hypothetical protein
MRFEPACNGTHADQFPNPLATPRRRIASFAHLTSVTPKLSEVVPLRMSDEPLYEYVVPLVGEAIATVGLVESEPLGGGVVAPPVLPPLVLDVVIVHEKVCDVLSTPSDARAVTLYVPAVVPVPEI